MKKEWILLLAVLTLLCLAFLPASAEKEQTYLTLYEGPKTMQSSTMATISVNGYDLFVYDVMVNHQHIYSNNALPSYTPMTYFDMEGKVNVEIAMCLCNAQQLRHRPHCGRWYRAFPDHGTRPVHSRFQ